MPVTLPWDTFQLTYLRPVINDLYKSQYDENILQATTYTVIADLFAKGLTDIGPLPSSTSIGGTKQINYVTPGSQIAESNLFYISIGDSQVNYTAPAGATLASVCAALTTLINNSTAIEFQAATAFNDNFRIRIVGDVVGVRFVQESAAARGVATNNPSLETLINTQPTTSQQVTAPIVNLVGTAQDAYSLIAAGVKYYVISDPITDLKTTAGLDIGKSEKLVQLAKSNYDLLTYAYIKIVKTQEMTHEQFWSQQFQVNSTALAGGGGSGELNLADRLAIIEKEQQGAQALVKIKADNNIRYAETQRRYQLESRADLEPYQATNGAYTSAGQFTISYLNDYNTELENTVIRDLKYLRYAFFGLGNGVVGVQTITGIPVNVSDYNVLNLKINSSHSIQFSIFELVSGNPNDGVYQLIGSPIVNSNDASNNQITPSYALGTSEYIRIDIKAYIEDVRFYLVGELLR